MTSALCSHMHSFLLSEQKRNSPISFGTRRVFRTLVANAPIFCKRSMTKEICREEGCLRGQAYPFWKFQDRNYNLDKNRPFWIASSERQSLSFPTGLCLSLQVCLCLCLLLRICVCFHAHFVLVCVLVRVVRCGIVCEEVCVHSLCRRICLRQ